MPMFDIDLSKISCSCNMAFYLTLNPGYDTSGNPVKNKWGKYECSAQGPFCPDMDFMQANMWNWETRLHKCDLPVGKHYASCDAGIKPCSHSFRDLGASSYGPGS